MASRSRELDAVTCRPLSPLHSPKSTTLPHFTPQRATSAFESSPPAPTATNALLPAHIQGGQTLLQPGEHPFTTTYAVERTEMRIEPNIYRDAVMHDFVAFGGRIIIRQFRTPADVAALPENVVVNCTGLGAKLLFGDEELVPLKGLLVILAPQDEVNYSTNGGVNIPPTQRGLFIHMMPRRDGIVLGGTSERGVATPDISATSTPPCRGPVPLCTDRLAHVGQDEVA